MKKILIVLLVVFVVFSSPLFAAEQILRAGMWAEASNLLDIRTPSELDFKLNPYAVYEYGRPSADSLTGRASINAPYVIGSEFDTLWPSMEGWFNYRINSGQSAIMETGLTLSSNKSDASGTYLDTVGYFDWYPYNQADEITVHQHFSDLIEGLRFGVGLEAGALVDQLLEDTDVTTTLHGGITGLLESGAQLSDHFWAQGYVELGIPSFTMSSSFDTYDLSVTGQFNASLSYVSERLIMTTGLTGGITADNILTQNGFLDGASYDYSFMWMGEVGYFFIDNLYVYGGAEFFGERGDMADFATAYVGLQYFLL